MVFNERILAEETPRGDFFDFTNKFLAARNFYGMVRARLKGVAPGTVDILEGVLNNKNLARERQSFFIP